SGIVVHPRRRTPVRATVVGVADHHVEVVTPVLHFEGIGEIDPSAMRTIAPIPGQARLGVHRTILLGRNVVEAAHVWVGDEGAVLERAADPGGIEAGEDLSATLPTLR